MWPLPPFSKIPSLPFPSFHEIGGYPTRWGFMADKIRRALLSVSDKHGILDLARGLSAMGWEIVSTGGTARALSEAGLKVRDVESVTGFPEMLDGRVKTLHPKVHGGLLGIRDNPSHRDQMAAHGIEPIDLVAVNLYPFEAAIAKPGATLDEAIENIDIGGPAMLRSAAKNFRDVIVLVDPGDYAGVLAEIQKTGTCRRRRGTSWRGRSSPTRAATTP